MTRAWQLTRVYGIDAAIAIAAVAAGLQVALGTGAEAPTAPHWFAVPAITLLVLVLLGRHRFPFAAPASVWTVAAALSFVDGRLVPFAASAFVAGFAAAFMLGNLRDEGQARVGLAIVLAGAAVVVYNDPSHDPGELVFTPLLFAIGWLAGFAMRGRTEQAEAAEARALEAERAREAAARVAVAEERARIARELHDVVAHAVSVMVLQVGAVRHGLSGASPADSDALAGVERTGRTALAEMRSLLGAMRHADDDVELAPQPGIAEIETLAAQIESAGLPVRVRVEGDPRPLPHGLELSAYRVVQEGLTNALKHANASEAEVTLEFGPADLEIEVRDDGGSSPEAQDDPGFGLVGIRERVKIYGGEMTATPGVGGYVLRVRFPLRGDGS